MSSRELRSLTLSNDGKVAVRLFRLRPTGQCGCPGRTKALERVIVEGQENLKAGMPLQTKAFKADVKRSNQGQKGIRHVHFFIGANCSDCIALLR